MKVKSNFDQRQISVCWCLGFTAVLGLIGTTAPNAYAQDTDKVTYVWPLTFTADKVTPFVKKSSDDKEGDESNAEGPEESEEPGTLEAMIGALNKAYGLSETDGPIKNVKGRFLVISGKKADVLQIRRHLTMFDTQWPQVQLDMWAVQITGSPKLITAKGIDLQNRFLKARQAMNIAKNCLLGRASHSSIRDDKLKANLEAVGFDTNADRRLSLTEALAFTALEPNPTQAIADIQASLAMELEKPENEILLERLPGVYKHPSGKAKRELLFRQLQAAMPDDDKLATKTINDFAAGLLKVKNAFNPLDAAKPDANDALNALPQRSAALDLLLQSGMDAFTEDMQEMFLRPILAQIQRESAQAGLHGVSLSGKTRQVVSNNLESRLDPEMSFSVNTTRPEPLNAEKLTELFGGGVAGAAKTLVLNQPEPEMTAVSPGIGIHVVPNILKNGSAARLQMAVKIAVETSTPDATANRLKSIPADAIKSHNIHTDAMISGFDLFDISSFSIETSHPRSRYLPLIGSIPLLGELIKKPRKNKVVHQESMIFVNAAILPRAMSLANNYGN